MERFGLVRWPDDRAAFMKGPRGTQRNLHEIREDLNFHIFPEFPLPLFSEDFLYFHIYMEFFLFLTICYP